VVVVVVGAAVVVVGVVVVVVVGPVDVTVGPVVDGAVDGAVDTATVVDEDAGGAASAHEATASASTMTSEKRGKSTKATLREAGRCALVRDSADSTAPGAFDDSRLASLRIGMHGFD
jgi:hypothetical protein